MSRSRFSGISVSWQTRYRESLMPQQTRYLAYLSSHKHVALETCYLAISFDVPNCYANVARSMVDRGRACYLGNALTSKSGIIQGGRSAKRYEVTSSLRPRPVPALRAGVRFRRGMWPQRRRRVLSEGAPTTCAYHHIRFRAVASAPLRNSSESSLRPDPQAKSAQPLLTSMVT